MNIVGTGGFGFADLVAKAGEISGEDGGRDLERALHVAIASCLRQYSSVVKFSSATLCSPQARVRPARGILERKQFARGRGRGRCRRRHRGRRWPYRC